MVGRNTCKEEKRGYEENNEEVVDIPSPIDFLLLCFLCVCFSDAPALKKADIGVAMGISGTEVSKDAADMILLDDNFASIVNGVEEGRIIFDNLRKSIAYTLASNIPEITSFLIFILAAVPLPLTTILILCIDLGTDMFPAISFASESKEADIMLRPPRNAQTDRLVDWRLLGWAYFQTGPLQTIAGFFTYMVVFHMHGFRLETLAGLDRGNHFTKDFLVCYDDRWPTCDYLTDGNIIPDPTRQLRFAADTELQKDTLALAQASFFVAIVIMQLANVIVCKTRKLSIFTKGFNNQLMIFGILFEFALCCFLSYIPSINGVFGTRPLGFVEWCLPLPFFIVAIVYDEARKYWVRNYPKSYWAWVSYY